MVYALTFLGVVALLFFADVCWTLYFLKIESRSSIWAGVYGALIYLFGAFAVTQYVQDKSLIVAAVIGSFLGTYVTVEYKKKKEKYENTKVTKRKNTK